MAASSGKDNPQIGIFSELPIVDSRLLPSTTTLDGIILRGSRPAGSNIFLNNAPVTTYPDATTWCAAVVLAVGVNSFTLKALYVGGGQSANMAFSITKLAHSVTIRALDFTITIDGVDRTSYASADRPYIYKSEFNFLTAECNITLLGDFYDEIRIGDPVVVRIYDGFVWQTIFDGDVYERKVVTNPNADDTTELVCHDETLDFGDLELVYSGVAGNTTDAVLKNLIFARAGISPSNIVIQTGHTYTGTRNFSGQSLSRIIRDICLAEQWTFYRDQDKNLLMFLPDYYFQVPSFIFDESEIMRLDIWEDRQNLTNRIQVKYSKEDKNIQNNESLGLGLIPPPGDPGDYRFFADHEFAVEVSSISPTGSINFWVWDTLLDWSALETATFYLKINDEATGLSTHDLQLGLTTFEGLGMGILIHDLQKYNLTADSLLYWRVSLSDGVTTHDTIWRQLEFDDTLPTTATMTDEFKIKLTGIKKLAEVSNSWTTADTATVPTVGVNGIVSVKYDQFSETMSDGTVKNYILMEWIHEVDATEYVLQSLEYDIDRAMGNPNKKVFLQNCELLTAGNTEYNFNQNLYAIIYNDPQAPLDRLQRIYFRFRARVERGTPVAYKFNVWGRQFVDNFAYTDPFTLDRTVSDATSIAQYGLKFRGTILNQYLATFQQVENLAVKLLAAHKNPLKHINFKMPLLAEIKQYMIFQVNYPSMGIAKLFYILSIDAGIEDIDIDALEVQTVTLAVENVTGATETKLARPLFFDTSFVSLSGMIAKEARQLEKGIIFGKKYQGVYHVKLISRNVVYNNVRSRIGDLTTGDTVLVADLGDGQKLIIDRISGGQTLPEFVNSGSITDIFTGDVMAGYRPGDLQSGYEFQKITAINTNPIIPYRPPAPAVNALAQDLSWTGESIVTDRASVSYEKNLVYLTTQNLYYPAKADADSTSLCIGIVVGYVSTTFYGIYNRRILLKGYYRNDILFANTSPGDIIYVSPTNAGGFVNSVPAVVGDRISIAGRIVMVGASDLTVGIKCLQFDPAANFTVVEEEPFSIDNLADGQYYGQAISATIIGTFALGDVLYLGPSGYSKAKADTDETCVASGMAIKNKAGYWLVFTSGYYRNDTLFAGLFNGDSLYVSPVTTGGFTKNKPFLAEQRINNFGKIVKEFQVLQFEPNPEFKVVKDTTKPETLIHVNPGNPVGPNFVESGVTKEIPLVAGWSVGSLITQLVNGTYNLAQADQDDGAVCVGILLKIIPADFGYTGTILTRGHYRNDTLFAGTSKGDKVFVSPADAGLPVFVEPAMPLNRVNQIGVMELDYTLDFNPNPNVRVIKDTEKPQNLIHVAPTAPQGPNYEAATKSAELNDYVEVGDFVAQDPTSGGEHFQVDANDENRCVCVGICIKDNSSGDPTIITLGHYRNNTLFAGFSKGAKIYVSETPGKVTPIKPTTPGAFVNVVGKMELATILDFAPSPNYLKIPG